MVKAWASAPSLQSAERLNTSGLHEFMAIAHNKPDRTAWLKGGEAECQVRPSSDVHPHRFVLLGAPGVGKGTQAELLSARLGACHLSTGDVFRAAKTLKECERSPAMTSALEYMRRGELVPDQTVLALVIERTRCLCCGGGFLLDGFPRTTAQARALQDRLEEIDIRLDAVLSYELPLEQIVSRLSGRRTCGNCKAVYHVETRPPKMSGICDSCGSALHQREDDRPESVRVRMDVYAKSTAPLADFYQQKGLLIPISAEGTPEEIFARTISALQKRQERAEV
jgi:adenylate kinase